MKPRAAMAQDDLRQQILAIPGVGNGSPTDADWQKVGELCLGATKSNVAEGEFAGVELTFMGLNNQNLHNLLFRGFLTSWEAYTGAKINWIDLAQADYNPRLQQAIATGTVDFDIIEMGAPFEGDTAGRGLLDEMPDWVKTQIDMDDYVNYLKAPVGTWAGKTYRITVDGDCHTFAYRKDYFGEGSISGMAEAPTTWQGVNAYSAAVKGQKDPLFSRTLNTHRLARCTSSDGEVSEAFEISGHLKSYLITLAVCPKRRLADQMILAYSFIFDSDSNSWGAILQKLFLKIQ